MALAIYIYCKFSKIYENGIIGIKRSCIGCHLGYPTNSNFSRDHSMTNHVQIGVNHVCVRAIQRHWQH